ncbi:hypothetical protein VNO80_14361 [Phaseolus coccineus]|uniref:Exportin-5 C-terminal domain-containing protein n=1 Tax=Phaseolus coccineus TaxID=3886 RepID=A0AAN9R1B6_PHACN
MIAATKVSEKIDTVFKGFLVSPTPTQLCFLHLVGILQRLISLKWTEPAIVEVLGHYLDAMGPFLKYFPDAVGSDTSMHSARHARLQICTSFIRIAKAADKRILPHMKREGCLLHSEHNLLGEAFLVMASSSGHQWTQSEWQNKYLSGPQGLVQLFSEAPVMWSIFHTLKFFERALKRSGLKKANWNSENSSTPNSTPINPMGSHISWMVTPLLKVCVPDIKRLAMLCFL